MKRFLLSLILILSLVIPWSQAHGLPASSSLEVLVNRTHPLKLSSYVPPDLAAPKVATLAHISDHEKLMRRPAAQALETLLGAAMSHGLSLALASGYRSYFDQANLYDESLFFGGVNAQMEVAPPAASEHQTGLAADLVLTNHFCPAEGCFIVSRAAAWLGSNSYRYGFILRYPLHKESITGYNYEPWHYRFVGQSLARELYHRQITLEEYYHVW